MVQGTNENGYYDGYYGDSGKTLETLPTYTDIVMKSTVSESLTYHLGGPVTQPSTMVRLRQDATVQCNANFTYYRRQMLTPCNVTECLFDIVNDPCETRNIAETYVRVSNRYEFTFTLFRLVKAISICQCVADLVLMLC